MPSQTFDEFVGNGTGEKAVETAGEVAKESIDPGEMSLKDLIEVKKMEKEAQEYLLENDSEEQGGMAKAIAEIGKEFAKDDDMKELIKRAMAGEGMLSEPDLSESDQNVTAETVPHETDNLPEGSYVLSVDETFVVIKSVLEDIEEMKPEWTVEDLVNHTDENEEMIKSGLKNMLDNATEKRNQMEGVENESD